MSDLEKIWLMTQHVKEDNQVVACKFCDHLTPMLGTGVCDNCWEVVRRIEKFLKSAAGRVYLRHLIDSYESKKENTENDQD